MGGDGDRIENFGWGRNADSLAREGTFYIAPGVPTAGGEPPVEARVSSREPGFVQPNAKYGRNDPNGGIAVTGPISSDESLDGTRAVFSDLSSGIIYATTARRTATDVPVFKVNLATEGGAALNSLNELAGRPRVDPRLFLFPDGTAAVLLEKTGDFYRLTELEADDNNDHHDD